MVLTYKQQFNKKHNQPLNQPNSLKDIARLSGYKLSGIEQVFALGIGAFKTNRAAVRPNITSPEAWGFSRVYAAVNPKSKAYKVDKIHLIKK